MRPAVVLTFPFFMTETCSSFLSDYGYKNNLFSGEYNRKKFLDDAFLS